MAKIQFRHRYHCATCKVEKTGTLYHFENPSVPYTGKRKPQHFLEPKGIWCEIKTAELHGILAHKDEPSAPV